MCCSIRCSITSVISVENDSIAESEPVGKLGSIFSGVDRQIGHVPTIKSAYSHDIFCLDTFLSISNVLAWLYIQSQLVINFRDSNSRLNLQLC
jgi:hypothetical protein